MECKHEVELLIHNFCINCSPNMFFISDTINTSTEKLSDKCIDLEVVVEVKCHWDGI